MKFTNRTKGVVEFCHGQEKLICLPGVEVDCSSSLFGELMTYPAVKGYFDLGLFVMTTVESLELPRQVDAPATVPEAKQKNKKSK